MELLPYVCVKDADKLHFYAMLGTIQINCLSMLKDLKTMELLVLELFKLYSLVSFISVIPLEYHILTLMLLVANLANTK